MGNSTAIDSPASTGRETDGVVEGSSELVATLLPSRTAAHDTERASERTVPEWEYRAELLEHGMFGWGREQVDLRKLQSRLDALGHDGWELVDASWSHRVRRRHGGHLLIFKRLKT